MLQKIGFKLIVIGYNHNFGKNREGNLASLEKLQTECTVNNRTIFAVKQVPKFSLTNNNVSSSTIRKMFEHDDIEQINKLLGYHYFIAGNVQAGNGIGATIGFPTANLNTFSTYKAIPKHGVYFCSVQVFNKQYWGITNIGFAPTFENNNATTSKNKLKLEVHIFDFFGDIYDVNIIVSFIKYLRKEKKFNNKDELIKQIQNDVVVCKQLIAQQKTTIKN
ncbi:Riboflavin biosynthesis protein RibF [bioreactor metagenome]|uniref:Riboflavin biosynthesis protein RibF n=1 Tax=bioreactor metagenome TaxID=1076179 RepID=A0A645F814_9ZZZZ